jgi:hypothetical protein
MDSQFAATREELYHVQMDVKLVQSVQNNHADRLLKLEKRQADDAALKSVWGTSSPFPGILSGTPQHGSSTVSSSQDKTLNCLIGPVPNLTNDVFDDFDDEQGQNLLGSLHLETDDEPVRRGASRANSVRFDVSALQGANWGAGSRNSGDFGPTRPSSGFGSHPMTERSFSHKSDGRHSSAGHSVHSASGRTSSLGLDTNFMIGGQDDESPMDIPDPPPGLFILGSVPSIIRCWLTTNFSHNALLYADVCSGSQRSILDYSLVQDLGLSNQIHKHPDGRHTIRLPVYLPEAIVTHPTSRTTSPAPQLPTLSADFEITGMTHRVSSGRRSAIRIFIGSNTLRAHNADILFSQNLMTIFGEDRQKLSVPFVRPEDENTFKYLSTTHMPPEQNELKATAVPFTPTESKLKVEATPQYLNSTLAKTLESVSGAPLSAVEPHHSMEITKSSISNWQPGDDYQPPTPNLEATPMNHDSRDDEKNFGAAKSSIDSDIVDGTPDSARRESSGGIWGSWRQGASINGSESESTSGYQRATRGARSMKVLKPSKPNLSNISAPVSLRTTSTARTGVSYEHAPSRPPGEPHRKSSQVSGAENGVLRWEAKKIGPEEQKTMKLVATAPRSSNPIGGASAFAWMNPSKPKASATSEAN